VTTIGTNAFQFQPPLIGVTIPNSITNIENGAFESCGLRNVMIPGSVTGIGPFAFAVCSSLTKVIFGNGVNSIGQRRSINVTP
jgi:hypothetical protein